MKAAKVGFPILVKFNFSILIESISFKKGIIGELRIIFFNLENASNTLEVSYSFSK